jgi:hypothetical protein
VRTEYRVKGQDLLLVEVRAVGDETNQWVEHGIAKIRFNRKWREWRLYWQRGSLKWEAYKPRSADRNLGVLVAEVDRDPHGCFFG